MKITRSQLHKIVSETLRQVKDAKNKLVTEAPDPEDMKSDVQKIITVLDKVPRFENMLELLNTRQEFYEFIEWMIDVADDRLPADSDAILSIKQSLNNLVKKQQMGGEEDSTGEEVELSPEQKAQLIDAAKKTKANTNISSPMENEEMIDIWMRNTIANLKGKEHSAAINYLGSNVSEWAPGYEGR